MHHDKSQYEEIKRYILGDMTALEKREFSDRMSNDDELSKNVDLQLFGRQLIIGQKLISVREKMTNEYDSYQPTPLWKKVAPVLVIVLLIAAGMLYTQLKDPAQDTKKEQSEEKTAAPSNKEKEETSQKEEQQETSAPEKQSEEKKNPEEKNNETESNDTQAISSPCDTTEIDFRVKVEETCEDSANGSISILKQTMTGGKAPYEAVIADDSTFSHTSLPKGLHAVTITDVHKCSRTKRIIIKSIACEQPSTTAPDTSAANAGGQNTDEPKNEYWKAPINVNDKVLLKITNSKDHTVFEDSVSTGFQWPLPEKNGPFTYKISQDNNVVSEGTIDE